MSRASEVEREQAVLARLYARLDDQRAMTRRRLAETRRRGASGTPQARSERDAFAALYEDRLAALEAVEAGLCFGRIDQATGEQFHIGRIGLSDDEHVAMLVDWRAPAAEGFYRATPTEPLGLVRRRQLRTRGREVLDVEDDVFDIDQLTDADRDTLGGGGALLAAVTSARTGRMRDIVATIQGEQDRVIRDDPAGVLVVQGGPGTGKTAVALHRAAYLLYNDRDRLARSGVLVVGPGTTFLRYIEQVLPALGETGVVTATLPGLLAQQLPGGRAGGPTRDRAAVAELKGDRRMSAVIANAVAAAQRIPDVDVVVPFEEHELVLTPHDVAGARSRARRARVRHNRARYGFARQLLRLLVGRLTELDPEQASERSVARALMATDEFRDLVNRFWPRLTAVEVVESLLTAEDALLGAARHVLNRAECRMLLRQSGDPWTDADAPLLDEAWALLGDPDEVLNLAAERRRGRADHEFAQQVISETGVAGRVDAATLAARFAGPARRRSVVDRAATDVDWEFGHVIVDEAQELSPMAWRMIARRCPTRSMTIVGDLAQASSPRGVSGWADVLDPIAAGRWRLRELTVNYRTPAEVMEVAGAVLHTIDSALQPPSSVRSAGERPTAVPVTRLGPSVAGIVADVASRVGDGRVAVVVPDELMDETWSAIRERLPELAASGADGLDAQVAVLRVADCKGLEFDEVVVVEPSRWAAAGSHGLRDLYVALTRATQRVTVVHSERLPAMLTADLFGNSADLSESADSSESPLPLTGTEQ